MESEKIERTGVALDGRHITPTAALRFLLFLYGKVMSIWICEDAADSRSDTINRYAFAEECLRGEYREEKQNYDLMSVVVLRLGRKGEDSGDDAIRLLSKLFSTELGYEKKLGALRDEFHIGVTEEINKEVFDVCNLSTGVYKKGDLDRAKKTALNLSAMGMPIDKIAQAVEVSVSTVQEWLSEPQVTPAK